MADENTMQLLLNNQMTKQGSTTERLNALIQQTNEQLQCGPECQRKKAGNKLQQDYLAARNRIKEGPEELNEAERKYFTFVHGEPWYDNFLKKKYEVSADSLADKLTQEHNKKHQRIMQSINKYQAETTYSKHMGELLDKYTDSNDNLERNIDSDRGATETNQRKTYYYEQDIENIQGWNKFFRTIYWFLVVVFVLYSILFKMQFKNVKLWVMLGCFIAYPYIATPIHKFILKVFKYIFKKVGI